MIELDQDDKNFQAEFGRYKNPPTHAHLIAMRYALPFAAPRFQDISLNMMLRPHVEGIYAFGRLDENGEFSQDEDDARFVPVHAGVDMTEYDTSLNIGTNGEVLDSPERIEHLEGQKRTVAIKQTLLAHLEGPHPDDPAQRVPSIHPKNRFSEHDLDIVFSHIDARLRGRAV